MMWRIGSTVLHQAEENQCLNEQVPYKSLKLVVLEQAESLLFFQFLQTLWPERCQKIHLSQKNR